MRTWAGLLLRGAVYATAIVLMYPVLLLCRIDPRIDYSEDLTYGTEELE